MSSSTTKFTLFSKLPAELRIAIWEHFPQPARVIGHLPCSECWSYYPADGEETDQARRKCASVHHPDWRLRYIVQPREQAIFPPLHACQESRRVWLPRYFCPPRYLTLQDYNLDITAIEEDRLRFDVPFISYERDIFTVFDSWTRANFTEEGTHHGPGFDPYLGLDRTKIQNVAFCEIGPRFISAVAGLGLQTLLSLKTVSLLAFGPNPHLDHLKAGTWQEMLAVDIQHVNCKVRDIPEQIVVEHPLFCENHYRLGHQYCMLSPEVRPLHRYLAVLKACLWHAQHWDMHEVIDAEEDPWWILLDYVLGDGDECPFANLGGCGVDGHSKYEILHWRSPFYITCKFLCEEAWMKKLDTLSVFDLESPGHYEAFIQFKETPEDRKRLPGPVNRLPRALDMQ